MATRSKCGSTNIQAMKRGVSFGLGFIGAADVITVCVDCGHQSVPGGTLWERQQAANAKQAKAEEETFARLLEERAGEMPEDEREEFRGHTRARRERFLMMSGIVPLLELTGGCVGCYVMADHGLEWGGFVTLVAGIVVAVATGSRLRQLARDPDSQ